MDNNSLAILELTLRAPKDVKIVQSIGSVMHGVLMEALPAADSAWLHQYSRRPFSQYIRFDTESQTVKWRVASLSQSVREKVLERLLMLPKSIFLKQKGFALEVLEQSWIKETNYSDLMDQFLGETQTYRKIKLEFMSPTSFKTDGNYSFFPQLTLIYQNLLRRWNTFSDADTLDEELIVTELIKHTKISDYRLNSQQFSLEKTRIPAFKGSIDIRADRALMVPKILALLAMYAEFSGIGIKTALGMGGINSSIIK